MRLLPLAATLLFTAASAWAQAPTMRTPSAPGQPSAQSATTPGGAVSTPSRRRTLQERFDMANTTHDGRLTVEQARAGRMMAVVRDFTAIDKANRGYVTVDDIKEHRRAMRQANRLARQAQAPQQPQQR